MLFGDLNWVSSLLQFAIYYGNDLLHNRLERGLAVAVFFETNPNFFIFLNI